MTTSDITRQIDELCRLAEVRAEAQHRPHEFEGMAPIDFLTSEERARMHDLKMALPSVFEEREQARTRIAEKLRRRRDARHSSL